MKHTAWISLGSNMGDRIQNLENAMTALDGEEGIRIAAVSPFYRTAPTDYLKQDWFVNGVVRIETDLSPVTLLDCLQHIQEAAGQGEKEIRFGPRLMDLDILLFDALEITTDRLVIPHPRMEKRRFVLIPLCDIDPEIRHPATGVLLRETLQEIPESGQEVEPL